jgi:hypothetical protein
MMKTSNKFAKYNYHTIIHHLIQNYMQMLDRIDAPLQRLEQSFSSSDETTRFEGRRNPSRLN